MKPQADQDFNKPVAYDQYGQALYTHPQGGSQQDSGPQVVYMTRAIDPHQQEISPEIRQKHDESVSKYPELNLSDGEYVISAVTRHPIGVISIWLVVILAVIMVLAIPTVIIATDSLPFQIPDKAIMSGVIVLLLVVVVLVLAGLVSTIVYNANRFYLTNESVMQYIQRSLFSKTNQTISLGNIEDASYRQRGILQTVLNYGSIRLSTEGEETTYRFNFVSNPERQIRMLNDAVEAFKNFRPVSSDD
jgi:membrane protein YdbS with pleckstrin-like domain